MFFEGHEPFFFPLRTCFSSADFKICLYMFGFHQRYYTVSRCGFIYGSQFGICSEYKRIPGTAEPGGLPSMGSHRVAHD